MKTYKKNRLFYRIYSDGERILEGCTDFPGCISRQEAQTLANDIDTATDKLMGAHVEVDETVPESEEPVQLRKPTSEGKPFYFNVLLPDGKNAKQRMEHFEAKDGQFFVIYKSSWNGGLSFRAATLEDYKELGNLMPPEEALRAQFENARAEFERRCLPKNHKKEKGFSGKMIDVETPAKRIAEKVRMACTCNFEDNNDMLRYYESIRELAQEGMDEEADKYHYRNAKYKAERVFSCYAECKVRDLPERKRNAICKKCRRNPEFEDNFTDGKEEK